MTKPKKPPTLAEAVEASIAKLVTDVMKDREASLTDKVKVLDRAMKWEAIKQKAADNEWGSGFNDDEEEGAGDGK